MEYKLQMSEVSPCIQRLKSLRCMVKSAKRVISSVIHCFSSHVYIFGKGAAGRIGDLGGPDWARGRSLETPTLTNKQHVPFMSGPLIENINSFVVLIAKSRGTLNFYVLQKKHFRFSIKISKFNCNAIVI